MTSQRSPSDGQNAAPLAAEVDGELPRVALGRGAAAPRDPVGRRRHDHADARSGDRREPAAVAAEQPDAPVAALVPRHHPSGFSTDACPLGAPHQPGHAEQRGGHAEQAHELRDANGAEHEGIRAERFGHEAAHRVQAEVDQEEGARRALEALAKHPDEQREHHRVPERFVQEGRVEELGLGVFERALARRDEELPRQIRRRAEGLLVEEVAPASDGLPERQARRGDVEIGPHGQPPEPGVAAADEDAAEDPAVDGESALPDGEDLRGSHRVVVQVERDVVEARAHETAQERELGRLEEVLGVEAAAPRIAMRQPEPDRHRGGHEQAVPAQREGTERGTRWGRGSGTSLSYTATASVCQINRAFGPE